MNQIKVNFLFLIIFSSMLYIVGCSNQDVSGNIQKEYYPNGNIKSEFQIVNGKDTVIKKTYYENGSPESYVSKKDNKQDGYTFSYYKNGKLSSVQQYLDGKAEGDFIWYNENGELSFYKKFINDRPISFMRFDGNGNIDLAAPFLTITNKKDTIKLGDTYSADINVNYLFPNFTCEIVAVIDSETPKKSHEINVLSLGIGTHATYKVTPIATGDYTYEIQAILTEMSDKTKRRIIKYTGEFIVVD